MSMMPTFESLKKSLTKSSPRFAEARARHRALGPYESAEALGAALRPGSALGTWERDRVIAAIVAENQLAADPVWQSLLLVAFEPMLVWLRGKLGPRDDEDADQEILLAFLEALRTVRADAYTTLGIRWATQVQLRGRREPEVERVDYDDEIHEGRPFGCGPDVKLEIRELFDAIEAKSGPEIAMAILATEVAGETLREYVARAYAELGPREQDSTYERLRHGRDRALRRALRALAPRLARAA
jgi:hypothetical protein